MIRVYHDKEFGKNFFGKDNPKIENLVPCAEVNTDDLDIAFQLTNHIDMDWWDNSGVRRMPNGSKRSTSIGDVMECNGKFSIVAAAGFRELEGKDYYAALIPSPTF